MENNKLKIAIVPGSFDPITYGHIDVVERAAAMYDKVYLAVMINDQKSYMFTLDQRTQIAKAAVAHLPSVEVISSDGMLWELTKNLGATAIVKGYRNDVDLEYEQKMAKYNKEHYPLADTVLLRSRDDLVDVSSTVVRNLLEDGQDLSAYLPISVVNEIKKIISK